MTDQNQQSQQPTAMQTAVEFSMAWLATQGDIGKMVQRTLMTALQDNDQLQQNLQGQTQNLVAAHQKIEQLQSELMHATPAHLGEISTSKSKP